MADKDIDKLAKEIVSLKDNPVIQNIEGKQKLDFQLIEDLQNRVKYLEEQLSKQVQFNDALVTKFIELENTIKGEQE